MNKNSSTFWHFSEVKTKYEGDWDFQAQRRLFPFMKTKKSKGRPFGGMIIPKSQIENIQKTQVLNLVKDVV